MRARATGLVILVVCAIGACGDESGDNERSDDEKQIRAVLTEALTATDPAICGRHATRRFLDQFRALRATTAVRACRRSDDLAAAQRVSVERVAVSGPRAGADIRPSGGQLPFKTLRIGLREAGGGWKLDRIKGGTLDRPAFLQFMRRQLSASPGSGSEREIADCTLRELEQTENAAVVKAFVRPDQRLLILPAIVCAVRREFTGSGVRESIVTCVIRRFRRELTTGATGRRLAADPAGAVKALDYGFGRKLGRRYGAGCVRTERLRLE
ncbi:MAG: hypothetical protein ACRDKY_05915 [Solirubrobacteraceae bacterium]